MKLKSLFAVALGGFVFFSCADKGGATKEVALSSENDSLSYAFGVDIAKNLESNKVENINIEAIAQGMKDQQGNGENLKMTPEEAGQFIRGFFDKKAQAETEVAKQEGADFLAENGKNPDVITTPSGLQYIILQEGTGEKPGPESTVKCHYHGTLLDGTVFDSSVERGEPIDFPVNGVIRGWTEALQMMPVGSKWKLFIPYDLAYGERGAGGKIGPYSTLIFEVELLEIVK